MWSASGSVARRALDAPLLDLDERLHLPYQLFDAFEADQGVEVRQGLLAGAALLASSGSRLFAGFPATATRS